mgnify:CR=1 FL=1
MKLENLLRESLVHALNPSVCDLDNESHGHNVPKNSETHFRLVIVSEAFDGLSRVKRHQLVYKAADEALKQSVRAPCWMSRECVERLPLEAEPC